MEHDIRKALSLVVSVCSILLVLASRLRPKGAPQKRPYFGCSTLVLVGVIGCAGLAWAQEEAPAPTPVPAPVPAVKPGATGATGAGVRKATVGPATRTVRSVTGRRRGARTAVPVPDAVMVDVREIAKEFGLGKLRDKSDYFTQKPNAELTPQVVVQMLGRGLGESDAMDGYIKWQLLSAITGELPGELAGAGVTAYRNGPGLVRRPGMDVAEKRVLDRDLRRAADGAEVAAQLDMEARRTDALNKSVLAYRDELFTRLPSGMPAYEAALDDVYERCRAGVGVQSLTDRLAGHATQWISNEASDAEVKQFSAMVSKLMMTPTPDYYDGVRKNDQGPGYVWNVRRADANSGGRLEEIVQCAGRRLGNAGAVDTGNSGRTRSMGRRGR